MNENRKIENKHKSVLNLKHVFIDEIIFERRENDNFKENLNFKLGCIVEPKEDSKFYIVKVSAELGDEDNLDTAYLKLSVCGEFNIEFNNDIDDNIKELLIKKNTISILFPYLRSYITTVTSQTGMKPIILPPINVNAVLENKK
mgnify:CR=1 FL=1